MRLGSPGESLDELESGQSCASIGHQGCCSINDAADARLVAAKLDIPFYVCNFKQDFGRIIDYFVGQYNAGRTPNPCIRCNDWLKFGKLHDYAEQIGAEYIASGHYARIDATDPDRPRLLRGVDAGKDQSYVLFGSPRCRLAKVLLPIGDYHKPQVREIARELDLPVFDKPDSQEICFVPDNDYASLVKRHTPEAVGPGKIMDMSGRAIGAHEGHQCFTIGQRRGIRVAVGHPLYVINKDPLANTITVGERKDLQSASLLADGANWLTDPPETRRWIRCVAKIRYNSEPAAAKVRMADGEGEGDADEQMIEVEFDEPQFAVAPGQAVVCYDGETVLCGGWISSAGPATQSLN